MQESFMFKMPQFLFISVMTLLSGKGDQATPNPGGQMGKPVGFPFMER